MKFLTKVCHYILEKEKEFLPSVCILLPSRRAVNFLKKEFESRGVFAEKMPAIYPIEDFLNRFYEKTTFVELLLFLQKVAYEVLNEGFQESRDNFLSWLPTLLKDFNLIDQNLVDARQLFTNLADIKRVEAWDLTEEEKNYAQNNLRYYFEFWDKIYLIYEQFKKTLKANNLAYIGMIYRQLAENIDLWLKDGYARYYFVGFHAFSKAEEKIIDQLISRKKVTLLWDSDKFYMEHEGENQAGKWLKKYKQKWGEWLWQEDLLLTQKKTVEIIATGSYTLQAQVARNLFEKWRKETNENKSTLIVISDENMLLPLLYAMGEVPYNITLGLSLQKSTLFKFILQVFDLQQNRKEEISDKNHIKYFRYHYTYITKILTNPFLKKCEQILLEKYRLTSHQSLLKQVRNYLIQNNKASCVVFEIRDIPKNLLSKEPDEAVRKTLEPFYGQMGKIFGYVFSVWSLENVNSVLLQVEKIVRFFAEILNSTQDNLEKSYVAHFSEIVTQLKEIIQKRNFQIDFRTFRNLFLQLSYEERLSLENNADSYLQVMGILETRAIDFDQVIVVPANEGIFPTVQKGKSLIPYDVACAFGLPTYKDYEAMHNYYFYRLLQRAEKVALIYCSARNVSPSTSSEVSRYAWQIEYDLAPRNADITIRKVNAQLTPLQALHNKEDLLITKDEEILKIVKQKLQEPLSPTALDTFIRCSLQYYFSYVVGIKPAKEIREEIEADLFGAIVHSVLEDIFGEIGEQHRICSSDLQKAINSVPQRVKQKFKEFVTLYNIDSFGVGNNLIAQEVAIFYIENFLKRQIAELQDDVKEEIFFEILSLENKPHLLRIEPARFTYHHNGEHIPIRIRGIVDRVDKYRGVLRIIDYKTSKLDERDTKVPLEFMEELVTKPNASKLRQLWLYRYLLLKNLDENPQWQSFRDMPVEAGFYSLRNPNGTLLTLEFSKEGDFANKKWFYQQTEEWISRVIRRMLNPQEPFKKTENLSVCEFCIYRNICARG